MRSLLFISIVAIVALSCSSGRVPTSSGESYNEDLEYLLPDIVVLEDSALQEKAQALAKRDYATIIPKYDVTRDLDAVLDSIVKLRADINYIDGYTILVYSGTSSERAHISKGRVFDILPEAEPILKFDEPNFRVKVGKYYSRLEAQRDYAAIKEQFSTATIVPERIYIN